MPNPPCQPAPFRIARSAFVLMLVPIAVAVADESVAMPTRAPDDGVSTPDTLIAADSYDFARHLRTAPPSEFPHVGHVVRAWQRYFARDAGVHDAASRNEPSGWRAFSDVACTTVGYAIRGAYENLVGRVSEATTDYPSTAEDRLAASVAQEYADFLRTRPWYEFDYADRLGRVWDASWWDDDVLRKWERKYALTTEYATKALVGWVVRGISDDTEVVAAPVNTTARP